jgi:hypothetical protein
MARVSRAVVIVIAASLGAHAAVLYKSVSPGGVIEFSDIPPDKNRIVDRIPLKDDGLIASAPPQAMAAATPEPLRDNDGAIARASAQLDLAEHALAIARQPFAATVDPLRLNVRRPARGDVERIEFFKRGVILARQNLMETLKRSRNAESQQTLTASAEPPAVRR